MWIVCRPLGSENLLLRGATLKNTEYIYGNSTQLMINVRNYLNFILFNIYIYFKNVQCNILNETFPFPLCSCGHLHWHGNKDGSQLPVQVSETICSGKVISFRFLLFHFYIIL